MESSALDSHGRGFIPADLPSAATVENTPGRDPIPTASSAHRLARCPTSSARAGSDEIDKALRSSACLRRKFTMAKSKGRVCIVDDDVRTLESTRLLLRTVPFDVRVYDSPRAFLADPARLSADCVVLDVLMPEHHGLQVQRLLAAERYCPPIVFLSGYADVPMAVEALRNGAFDFLEKPCRPHQLLERVQSAVARGAELRMLAEKREALRKKLSLLTEREEQVVQLIMQGHVTKQIAGALGISARTVEDHRARIMRKLGVRNFPRLILLLVADQFLSSGVVPIPD